MKTPLTLNFNPGIQGLKWGGTQGYSVLLPLTALQKRPL